MAAKGGYPSTCAQPGVHFIGGSFVTAGASAPTVLTGSRASVSAPSSGVYTITLLDGPFAGVVTGFLELEDSTVNANDTVRYGDLDAVATAGTFTVITASAAGTDANLTGPKVLWGLWLRNTGIEK